MTLVCKQDSLFWGMAANENVIEWIKLKMHWDDTENYF